VHPTEMDLVQFVENRRNNALQRAQLANDLLKRLGSEQFLQQALSAEGEVLAYETVLRRLLKPAPEEAAAEQ